MQRPEVLRHGRSCIVSNRRIIWIAAVLGVQSYVTQEPLRAGKDASSPLATLGWVDWYRALMTEWHFPVWWRRHCPR